MSNVIIVGAGPAGISAAATFLDHGLHPIVLEEGPHPGGQGFKVPSDHVDLDMAWLLDGEYSAYQRLHATAKQVLMQTDFQPQTSVWAVHDGHVHINANAGVRALPYDILVLATGAIDRIYPVAGWTLPGVYTLGAAQVLLKSQGHLIGRHVVFAGSSPLLYLAANQYRRAGAQIAGILDTTPYAQKVMAAAKFAAAPIISMRGIGYVRALKAGGVQVKHGVRSMRFGAGKDGGVAGVRYENSTGSEEEVVCDAVAFGFGLRPETQLADLAGCRFRYDDLQQMWFPEMDQNGHAGNGVYLVGGGAAIGGAVAAQSSGRLAALAALGSLGYNVSRFEITRLRNRTARLRYFQKGLARAFAWPPQPESTMDDDTLVCRCESVKVGTVREALGNELGPVEINRIKALTRCGMGRCQGRFCELAVARIAAAALDLPVQSLGRLRGQPPVKPLTLTAVGREGAGQ
ncbi:MAG: NAD(P)/FAD-dependent oxidoreductase [Hyphomicrobiales bacterium]|nr:NAD(P)/FAD-dependent oxidoreductase [Hyphomicrobiales bacterium]